MTTTPQFPGSVTPPGSPQLLRALCAFPPVRVRGRLTRGGAIATSVEGAKMAAAGGERRGLVGRALCLLLLCGWSLAARGQDSPGERRGDGRGGWLRAVGCPADLPQRCVRLGLEYCASSAGAGPALR